MDSDGKDWPADFMMEENEVDKLNLSLEVVSDQQNVPKKRETKSQNEVDKKDEEVCTKMYSKVCCDSWNCTYNIPKMNVLQHRQNIQELSEREKEIAIMCQIAAHRRRSDYKEVYKKRSKREDVADYKYRCNMRYFFHDVEICRNMFLFMYDITVSKFETLVKHVKDNGIVPRTHGLANNPRTWGKVVTPAAIERVVNFIKDIGKQQGMPLPGRIPQFHNFDVIKLPSDMTKISVWKKYCEAVGDEDEKIARTTFIKIWNKYCPYVTRMKPSTDLCDQVLCRLNYEEIGRATNRSPANKFQTIQDVNIFISNRFSLT